MPSLGYEWFNVRGDDQVGEAYKFKGDITVDRDGVFSITMPSELVKTAQDNARKDVCQVRKLRTNWAVQAKSLSECRRFIEKATRDYLRCEVIRETVIVYKTEAKVAYWKTEDEEIVPNGEFDANYNAFKGKWGGCANQMNESLSYSVGLVAGVYTRVTAHRESGDQVVFEQFEDESGQGDVEMTWAKKLNSFIRVDIDSYELPGMSAIPYTEEAAQFFYETMLTMCKLSDRIETFFGDPSRVQKAIETRSAFMLPASIGERAA